MTVYTAIVGTGNSLVPGCQDVPRHEAMYLGNYRSDDDAQTALTFIGWSHPGYLDAAIVPFDVEPCRKRIFIHGFNARATGKCGDTLKGLDDTVKILLCKECGGDYDVTDTR